MKRMLLLTPNSCFPCPVLPLDAYQLKATSFRSTTPSCPISQLVYAALDAGQNIPPSRYGDKEAKEEGVYEIGEMHIFYVYLIRFEIPLGLHSHWPLIG
jgi:hypothetical protein